MIKQILKKVFPHQKTDIVYPIKKMLRQMNINLNSDYKATTIVSGSGRSGTTWIAEIINYKNDYRIMFEPFHPNEVMIWKKVKPEVYYSPNQQRKDYENTVRNILSGKINDNWIDSYYVPKFIYRKRLIKDITTNLLIKGIDSRFPGIPIILLLRHPCAVALSQIKNKFINDLNDFLNAEELVKDFLQPFVDRIKSAQNEFEKSIYLWCIQNYVPLKQFKEGKIHVAFYENFCNKPEFEISRLFSFLNLKYDDRVYEQLKRASRTAWEGKQVIISGNHTINGWKKELSDHEIKKALNILKTFGLDKIYTDDAMPNESSVWEI